MKRTLTGLALFLLLAMALADAIWPASPELMIDVRPASAIVAGGDWCDVNHPPVRPRVKNFTDPRNPAEPDQRTIA